MKIYNSTDCTVILYVDNRVFSLNSYESVIIDTSDKVIVELKHNYLSKAMSKEEIANDHIDDSILSLAYFSHKNPYFNIVLDCKYEISYSNETELVIEKQVIRPSYFCSYDRFLVIANGGTVNTISHTFVEEQNFKKHYMEAINGSNKKIITILLIILSIFAVPIILICFLINLLGGLIALVLASAFLLLVKYAGFYINKLLCYADCKLVFSDFESCRIIEYFNGTQG